MTQLKLAKGDIVLRQKHAEICNEYLELSNRYPDAAPHRIFDTIADRHEMTIPGVRNIVIKAGLYTSKQKPTNKPARR